jgi:hypothetical protein
MGYTVPAYSRREVDLAGDALVKYPDNKYPTDKALTVISNFRSSHSRPLNTMMVSLRRRSREVNNNCLVAQRVKRLSSIVAKLRRFAGLRLSQMQDVGGCRVVLSSVDEIYEVVEKFKKSSIRHELARTDDYIKEPKDSGYRGVHLIYKYVSDRKTTYNGTKIEIQIRSQLQHAWATAVETVGTFIQQALKSSQGEDDWLRFFSLMSSVLALRENSPTVPDTPLAPEELKEQLRYYVSLLDVEQHLHTYGAALKSFEDQSIAGAQYYLLELDPALKTVQVTGFKQHQLAAAEQQYIKLEKEIQENPGRDAVLVSVESIEVLHRAYPNYFLDTNYFIEAVKEAVK